MWLKLNDKYVKADSITSASITSTDKTVFDHTTGQNVVVTTYGVSYNTTKLKDQIETHQEAQEYLDEFMSRLNAYIVTLPA